MTEQCVRVIVELGFDEFKPFYEGIAREVVAPSLDGRYIRFPASALRPFFTHNGINGIFELRFSAKNKLISLQKVK